MARSNHPEQAYEEERHQCSRLMTFPGPIPAHRSGWQGEGDAPEPSPVVADWERMLQAIFARVSDMFAANKKSLRIDPKREADAISQYAVSPDEVRAFCEKHSMCSELEVAIRLAKTMFPSLQSLSVGISTDPEWEVEKAVVSVELACEPQEASAAYEAFVTEWIGAADWEARKRIRLSYNLVSP